MVKPLTEKYRPKTFEEMVGNEKIKNSVKRMIKKKELLDMIFYGTYGVGKTTLADIIARCVTDYPVGRIYINASDMNKKADIHDKVIENSKTITSGEYKIVILDEAESLTPKAQQSLKSYLENKYDNIKIIFIVNDYSKIIDALKDRCINYKFKKIDTNKVLGRITYISKEEKMNYTNEELDIIANNSNGSLRRAIKQLQVGDIESIKKGDNDLEIKSVFSDITAKKIKSAYKKLYKIFEEKQFSIVIDELFNFVYQNISVESVFLNISDLERSLRSGCSIYTVSMEFVIKTKNSIYRKIKK